MKLKFLNALVIVLVKQKKTSSKCSFLESIILLKKRLSSKIKNLTNTTTDLLIALHTNGNFKCTYHIRVFRSVKKFSKCFVHYNVFIYVVYLFIHFITAKTHLQNILFILNYFFGVAIQYSIYIGPI